VNAFLQWIADACRSAKWWAVVLPWEQAVRVRAGKHTKLLSPGWHWRIPFVDEVRTFNNRLRLASFPSLTVTSKDGKTITAAGLIGFRISDPLTAMLALSQPEATCGGLAMGHVARYLSERSFEAVSAEEVGVSAAQAIEEQAPGCSVEFVRLVDFACVRTFRLLQDQWRPGTDRDASL
jgi:regulator of protease activity HflC (stomatin/prohibitin superfamily)